MHPTPLFRIDDAQKSLAFVAAHPFAAVVVNGKDSPVTALVPLVLGDDSSVLLGHVARANPFWTAAQRTACKATAIFSGPHGYVSPSSYASKAAHGKTVPTWNYLAVEIRGHISVETNPAMMEPYLQALTDKMESSRPQPWQISDAPSDYIAKLSAAIIGFRINIDDIIHVEKLSQNKSLQDRRGVITDFKNSKNPQEQALAAEMTLEG